LGVPTVLYATFTFFVCHILDLIGSILCNVLNDD
jgi:hypothetical protein